MVLDGLSAEKAGLPLHFQEHHHSTSPKHTESVSPSLLSQSLWFSPSHGADPNSQVPWNLPAPTPFSLDDDIFSPSYKLLDILPVLLYQVVWPADPASLC